MSPNIQDLIHTNKTKSNKITGDIATLGLYHHLPLKLFKIVWSGK
uniref:Uncharacterized protein n=1 Tax=Anguilla anguilla TaxID=7936 RepID=A0A0E9WYL2_ANGAN